MLLRLLIAAVLLLGRPRPRRRRLYSRQSRQAPGRRRGAAAGPGAPAGGRAAAAGRHAAQGRPICASAKCRRRTCRTAPSSRTRMRAPRSAAPCSAATSMPVAPVLRRATCCGRATAASSPPCCAGHAGPSRSGWMPSHRRRRADLARRPGGRDPDPGTSSAATPRSAAAWSAETVLTDIRVIAVDQQIAQGATRPPQAGGRHRAGWPAP